MMFTGGSHYRKKDNANRRRDRIPRHNNTEVRISITNFYCVDFIVIRTSKIEQTAGKRGQAHPN